MATFREIIYAALDLLKETTDDAYYTEEHMLFLATKMRAVLLERKYSKSRNKSFSQVSDANSQTICLDLTQTKLLPSGCGGNWLVSEPIPDTLSISEPSVYPVNQMLSSQIAWIPAERMQYVGHNKWLKNIIYAAKDDSNRLYLHSENPQFRFLKQVRMSAVFADPMKALDLTCSNDSTEKCEPLDMVFPLEESLVASCIELMVQEVAGPRYAPEDKQNDAKDNLSDVGYTKTQAPVEREERRRSQPEE